MKYYERLRQAREDADLTQAQAAEIIQTTQSYFSRQELGKKPFRVEQVAKLCEYYHVSSDYILGLSRDLNWPRNH
ncbi:hypothetical protein N510_002229 [Firmicutes bacterium ASF500]|nr:hypothetical protein N510_002229 [Firmicutes bacterium ASF500]